MAEMTGGEAIVRSLIAHGVTTLFGLPGVQNDPLFNALYDCRDRIRVIHSRHEQGAAYMALGYAMATGGVGAYAVVPGPGFLNTTAALATAYATNARVLCLTGQVPSQAIGAGLGMLHEIPDQLGVMRSLTKWAERIPSPADAPVKVAEAFRQMQTGRPRPAGLEMAMDVMAARGEVSIGAVAPPQPPPAPDPEAVARAAEVLGRAENPLIFVGGGAAEAGEQVAALAEMLQAPVVASPPGRGVLSSRHPFSHTLPAGYRLWAKADAVLAVGTRLQAPLMLWGWDDRLRVVRVDIDPEQPARITPPAVALVADARTALAALIPQLETRNRKRAGGLEASVALRQEMAAGFAALQPQSALLEVIREALPDDGIFVDELTQVGYVGRFAYPVYQPRSYLTSSYQGTLGWGVATAIGAQIASPGRKVLAISGDGGFLFNVQELATAVQNQVGVVLVVFNDGAYGNVRRMQKNLYGGREIATALHNPDFVKLAESFGAQGLRAEGPEQLGRAIRAGFAEAGPTVIEVPVGEMADPWPFIHFPRLRG